MKKAVVLLSGGLDSSTCLALATERGFECHTIAFDYGQRHSAELQAAAKVSEHFKAKSHRVVKVGIDALGGSSLTDANTELPEPSDDESVPSTYVPARNTIFLSIALGLAEVLNAQHIFIGIHHVDASNYPDCSSSFLRAFQQLAKEATASEQDFVIEAPLVEMSKAEIIKTAHTLGVPLAATISCYGANAQGQACGKCESCAIRRQGFADGGLVDQTLYA